MSPIDHENPRGIVLRRRFIGSFNLSNSQDLFLMEFKCRFDTSLGFLSKIFRKAEASFRDGRKDELVFAASGRR